MNAAEAYDLIVHHHRDITPNIKAILEALEKSARAAGYDAGYRMGQETRRSADR